MGISKEKETVLKTTQSQVDQLNYKALKLRIIELTKTLNEFKKLARKKTVEATELQPQIDNLKTQIDALEKIANHKRD